ncbi:hypothetical protein [Methylocystis bryophila]|nr:hypothetical protein [Methylocystis bryophila]BDV37625.1 hypothetical protein DSM21852_08780 [Methylocystis bryophila]
MKAIKPLLLLVSALSFSGAAAAVERAGSVGDTSGPAVGTPVAPSTVVQKANPYVGGRPSRQSEAAAGAPGIEAAPGTEAGTVAGGAPSNRK